MECLHLSHGSVLLTEDRTSHYKVPIKLYGNSNSNFLVDKPCGNSNSNFLVETIKTQLRKKIVSKNLDQGILILEKFYHINVRSGQKDRKYDSLTKKNRPEQNYSSLTNLKYKPSGLITANNHAYRTKRKKILATLRYKMSRVQ